MRSPRTLLLVTCLAAAIILPARAQTTDFEQNCVTNGANNATLVVEQAVSPTLAGEESLAAGDTLFAYTDDGLCAGYAAWTGSDDVSFSIAGPNAATDDPADQGFASGEPLKVKIYDASTDQLTDYEDNVTYTSCDEVGLVLCNDEGTYTSDEVYVVEGLSKTALPVELTEFEALRTGETVTLEWHTASEVNNSGFKIQHRVEGTASWSTLSFVEGSGTTSSPQEYRYETSELDYGVHQFRLAQIDHDGSRSTSRTVDVQVALNSAYDISKVSPNPVRRGGTLDLTVQDDQHVTVRVYDLLGREQGVLFDESLPADQTRTLRLDTGRLPSGQYFVRIKGEQFQVTRRMTVVK